ncbi:MAG: glycosyltransferase family 9 protein [Candidatus Obscuribacterales bacterium]|nr:glycosyltransferase family 9 protein [Candidatus Obscuribacterales bacterium]
MDKIVIFHAAAIGDAVMATPVSAALRKTYPQAKIVCITHESLLTLLARVPTIDECVAFDKSELTGPIRQQIQALKPNLIVDLSGSSKSFWQTTLLAKKIVRYKKQDPKEKNTKHAVANFLETLKPLGIELDIPPFPTLFPAQSDKDSVRRQLVKEGRRLVALVPGVGSARPHRAWPESQWVALAKAVLWQEQHAVLLIGGSDERTMCSRIAEQAGKGCYNLAGKLSLPETAGALSICDAIVSGDTGPAHLGIAVGTPVVGIYGPTKLERSGPYDMQNHCISVSDQCKCLHLKSCPLSSESSGACMQQIPYKVVYEKLEPLIRVQDEDVESTVRQDDWGHLDLDQEIDIETMLSDERDRANDDM